MSESVFANELRKVAIALASGLHESIQIPERWVRQHLEGKKSASNAGSYIRQIMGRVPEVAEKGRVSVSKKPYGPDSEYFGENYFDVAIVSAPNRRVYNKAALEKAVAKAKRQVAESMLKVSPNLANYSPDEYETLAKAIADFHAIIKETYLNNEEQ
ncbi:hypothetical protein vojen_5 [Escherichia phage vojen]|uniref:Uncharacterized protein n=1 Tax=Escherichia phage vojen TaxID=2696460 RepID=A0A6B9WKS3_9CAUD|nr:hypothetical protein H1N88_gp05 [Escherichia phage vojen]QHR65326.1 hypothetical protein vojen_5 [Escherichia phage vojen]